VAESDEARWSELRHGSGPGGVHAPNVRCLVRRHRAKTARESPECEKSRAIASLECAKYRSEHVLFMRREPRRNRGVPGLHGVASNVASFFIRRTPEMSHDPADFQLVSEPAVAPENGQAGVVGSGDLLGRVLVACEYSGAVRAAFAALGWDAWSCDLLPSEKPGQHYVGDVRDILGDGWDVMIAHPPCTHLAVSGARWFKDKVREQAEALEFVRLLLDAPIEHIALENPVSVISSEIRKPDQIIQPFEYGDPFRKTTCLWLKGLPKLKPTCIMQERKQQCWLEPPGPDRWKRRSRTYPGIARAMAQMWSDFVIGIKQNQSHQVSEVADLPLFDSLKNGHRTAR